MPRTKKHVPARHTTTGHYNMQYPDLEREGFVIPPETQLESLYWISNDGARAYLCHMPKGRLIAWIKNTDDIAE